MSQIFNKEKRMRASITLHKQSMTTAEYGLAYDYLKALEEVAEAAKQYHNNSTPVNGMHLYDALAKVDWMEA